MKPEIIAMMHLSNHKKQAGFLFFLSLVFLLLPGIFVRAYAAGDEDGIKPDNGIPVLYLNIDESLGSIEDMLLSVDHSVYCYGTVSIDVPEGFHYADFPDNVCESVSGLSMSIRGRGNSTWRQSSKKPYKIKLDEKTDLFGLGKNKHWVLVANAFDDSLLKDRITAWLGDRLGFEFTPRGVPVDVVMTGESFGEHYLGSFYLSENVRIDENRLEIDELSKEDTEEPDITGGYLVQNAAQVRAGSPDRFYTSRGVDWATDTPSFDTEADAVSEASDETAGGLLSEESFSHPELADAYKNDAQQQYIQRHIQKVEDSLYEEGTGYRELMDVESAAKYWLINEVSLNDDAFSTGSTYIYKKRDEDGVAGKVYWGPLWDFDFAWDHRITTAGMKAGHLWMRALFCDREEGGFTEEVKKQWPVLKEALEEITSEGGLIDQYCEETRRSAEADRAVNHDDAEDFDYAGAVEHLKEWIIERTAWFDEHLDLVDSLVWQVTYRADGEFYARDFKENSSFSYIDGTEDHPEKDGYVFLGWTDEDGNLIDSRTPVTRDMVLEAAYIPEEEATQVRDITFQRNSDAVEYDPYLPYYTVEYRVVPQDAQDKRIDWTVSDESVASIDRKGVVTCRKEGKVTITAAFKNGVRRSFDLYITSGEIALPTDLGAEEPELLLSEGEQAVIVLKTEPAASRVGFYDYASDNEAAVKVDDYGVVTAVGIGEAMITATTVTNGKGWGQYTVLKTEIRVRVNGPVPEESSEITKESSTEEVIRPTDNPKPEVGASPGENKNDEPSVEKGRSRKVLTVCLALFGAVLLILAAVLLGKRLKKRKAG